MIDACSWDHPGADAYTGTPRAAIERMAEIPAPVRAVLIARAERSDYDDVVMIDRDSITSTKHTYAPGIRHMAFGGKGKVCATVTRSGWAPERVETAMVFCEQGWCVIRPSICNNWSIVERREQQDEPAASSDVIDGPRASPVETPLAEAGAQADAAPLGGGGYVVPWAMPGGGFGGGYWHETTIVVAPCVVCACAPVTPGPVAPVPEPASAALMLAGLGLLVGWARARACC